MRPPFFAFKVLWYHSHSLGYAGKVVGIQDTEVVSDHWEGLYDALVEHIDDYIDEIREAAGLPYEKGKIEVTFEEVSQEEFGPLCPDEPWDED